MDALAAVRERDAGKVSVLEAEQAGLPGLIRDAVAQGKPLEVMELRERLAALPEEILVNQLSLARLQVAQLLRRAEQARAQQAEAWARVEKTQAALKKAKAEARAATATHGDLLAEEQEARSTARQRRNWLGAQAHLLAKARG